MALELRGIELRVEGQVHIHPTDLALAPNGFNVLLGPTLSGKTTLLRLMAGLLPPSSGDILFQGNKVTGAPVQSRNVAMVYQQFINYGHLSVFDNIASPLAVARVPRSEIKARVGRMAEMLQLTPLLDRRPSELSGGQQQRTALARALVKDAALVLLDEPLANLDYKLREALRDELPKLFADRDCTVVYATTEPAEALLLGGHTATVHEGRITQFADTAKVYRRPVDHRTACAFSDPPMNSAPVQKRGPGFHLDHLTFWPVPPALASLADGEYLLGLRPHHVRPLGATAGEEPVVEGRVSIAEISGSESVVHFELQGRTWVSLSHGVLGFAVGQSARFALDLKRAMYFATDGRCLSSLEN